MMQNEEMASVTKENVMLITSSISAIQRLRTGVAKTFSHLNQGITTSKDGEDNKKVFLTRFQQDLVHVKNSFDELDSMVGSLQLLKDAATMGTLGLINLDPVLDKTPIYPQVLQTYKWSGKLREHAQTAETILNRQCPKRVYGHIGIFSKKRKVQPSSHAYNPVHVDKFFDTWQKSYSGVEVKRVQQSPNVFQVTLGRTMQVILVLQSFIIERMIVRAHHETILQEDGSLDLWTQSKYAVFRKITDHATSAMLNFHFTTMPELSVKSFMLWLNSFSRLFITPCKKCGKILKGNMPPTWRDFASLAAFHESCRQ